MRKERTLGSKASWSDDSVPRLNLEGDDAIRLMLSVASANGATNKDGDEAVGEGDDAVVHQAAEGLLAAMDRSRAIIDRLWALKKGRGTGDGSAAPPTDGSADRLADALYASQVVLMEFGARAWARSHLSADRAGGTGSGLEQAACFSLLGIRSTLEPQAAETATSADSNKNEGRGADQEGEGAGGDSAAG